MKHTNRVFGPLGTFVWEEEFTAAEYAVQCNPGVDLDDCYGAVAVGIGALYAASLPVPMARVLRELERGPA